MPDYKDVEGSLLFKFNSNLAIRDTHIKVKSVFILTRIHLLTLLYSQNAIFLEFKFKNSPLPIKCGRWDGHFNFIFNSGVRIMGLILLRRHYGFREFSIILANASDIKPRPHGDVKLLCITPPHNLSFDNLVLR